MAITKLKRKMRKNRTRANNRKQVIKQYTQLPTIKNVSIEKIKEAFQAQ